MSQLGPPLVTVITATYNRASLLPRAVCSLLSQSEANWEYFIVDDASTDNTAQVVAELVRNDPRVKYIKLDKNQGTNIARMEALRQARGEWTTFLDSDNEFVPGAIETIARTAPSVKSGLIYYLCQNRRGALMAQGPSQASVTPFVEFIRGALGGEYFPVIRTSALRAIPLDPTIRGGERMTWLCIAKEFGGVATVPEVLIRYDDEGVDRLSVRGKNIERIRQVYWREVQLLWRVYLRYAPAAFFLICAKCLFYRFFSLVLK